MSLPRSRQGGFVLVLTLWILAIMTVGAAFFASRIESAVDLARQSQLNVRGLIDLADTLSPEVAQAVETVAARALEQLEAWAAKSC